MKRKIAVVTGSRADYGLLRGLLRLFARDPEIELQFFITGTHLSSDFGLTWREIEKDGFKISGKVEILSDKTDASAVVESMARAMAGFCKLYKSLEPEQLVLLGDRYEIFSAAAAALIFKIPVAHIFGGDVTEGAFDDALRHCITKMSHFHFVSHEMAAKRVRQLGEDPERIFVVGSPGLDSIRETKLLDRTSLEIELDFKLKQKNLLITFHPATLEYEEPEKQFVELLRALDRFNGTLGLIFTKPNADTGGLSISKKIDEYVATRPWARAYDSLGQRLYFSAIAFTDAVVGNSSSGIYEAPSFGKPTVNIGDRQKGRLQAKSILNCPPLADAIFLSIQEALQKDFRNVTNPYGDGHSSDRIYNKLKQISEQKFDLKKKFVELPLEALT